ncbi:MAG: Bax inhibitor-1/YccA family protein [Gammaproteobacteria bacterium]|nr:Bax inhibitor-1/YccA family protein [Gammaproteobacteria bacterium]
MNQNDFAVAKKAESVLATNKVLRNTYSLLAMTLIFSGLTAGLSVFFDIGRGMSLVAFGVAFVLMLFVLPKMANSTSGIFAVFAITGLLGVSIGPMLNHYLSIPGGSQIVTMAFGGTGVIFLALSGYVLTTKKDFTFMGGFLVVGLVVAFIAILANLFLQMPALSLALSAVIILLMSGFILYDTGRIINGGETNYIMATVSLYISIFNIFSSLLHLLGFAGGDD